ncbi:arfaptin-2 isoform X2 [Chroicocephalus ridibundus]|uniref:arfaptin-2 isoform X2 n=1 Tax=Chroicocephalus ridibundus TaxID=1192867 RepID=UPI002FDEDEF3
MAARRGTGQGGCCLVQPHPPRGPSVSPSASAASRMANQAGASAGTAPARPLDGAPRPPPARAGPLAPRLGRLVSTGVPRGTSMETWLQPDTATAVGGGEPAAAGGRAAGTRLPQRLQRGLGPGAGGRGRCCRGPGWLRGETRAVPGCGTSLPQPGAHACAPPGAAVAFSVPLSEEAAEGGEERGAAPEVPGPRRWERDWRRDSHGARLGSVPSAGLPASTARALRGTLWKGSQERVPCTGAGSGHRLAGTQHRETSWSPERRQLVPSLQRGRAARCPALSGCGGSFPGRAEPGAAQTARLLCLGFAEPQRGPAGVLRPWQGPEPSCEGSGLHQPHAGPAVGGEEVVRGIAVEKFDIVKKWGINTYKCTKQLISERFGRGSRTVDLELETQIELLRETKRKYECVLQLARALTNHFYSLVQTQHALGDAFADLSQKSPELQEEFGYNAETQKLLCKNGETLLGAVNFFVSSINTLVNKTMEDTLMTVKQYETARLEYDAYRTDLEELSMGPRDASTLCRLDAAQSQFQSHKDKYEKLRADVAIKLKFLEENKIKVMHKQLLLFHNAISAYFAGNQQQLEQTLKQFNIKLKTPGAEKPSWLEEQ